MVMFYFVPSLREATFCGVPSYVSDKWGCAVGEKRLRNTVVSNGDVSCKSNMSELASAAKMDGSITWICNLLLGD
jgi:hypothetical protein